MLELRIRESDVGRRTIQRTDPPETRRVLDSLLAISKSVRALYGLRLAEVGLHNGQDELLLVVGDAGCTVNGLAEKLHVRPPTVSKTVDRLTEKGLVRRSADADDARRTVVGLTEEGADVCRKLAELRAEVDATLSKILDADVDVRGTASERLDRCAILLAGHLRRLR